ncbi:hypothetical protein POM88_042749 [Heracleum sosnowskyi]|uniref:Autophagy-related protein n=1 Tax=Heracleum sosnowskyi TaxID=360622 RepID=A0AAD8MCH0_9APIA|nr:hypothetical protein POM88_042749 [Heracleum sosnowskyi]
MFIPEERQAEVERLREKHPDLIPVIILQAEGSQMQYPKKKLLIPAKDNLKEFFVSAWKILYELEIMSKTYSLFSGVEHKDPIFEKLMSSVYEEYKDEDGCLYITLSGEVKDMLTEEPIPSNIKTFTCYI